MKTFEARGARKGANLLYPLALVVLSACGDPAGPTLPELEIVVAAGDGQFGSVGQVLPTRLHAVVRRADTGAPRKDVTVLWEVESGDASFVTGAAQATDSTGSTFATVRLGETAGDVVVRVTTVDQETATASFQAHAVDRPQLTGLSASLVQAGAALTLAGSSFHPSADQNVVLFSGIRGEVLSGGQDELEVRVPACLPTRSVDVQVVLGSVSSNVLPVSVTGDGGAATLEPGEVLDVPHPSAPGCLRLAGGSGGIYLAVAHSAAFTAAAEYPTSFLGLVSAASTGASAAPGREGGSDGPHVLSGDLQGSWDAKLRLSEQSLARAHRRSRLGPARTAAPEAVPAVGDERTFKVLNGEGGFDDVTAVARHVGARVVLYEDKDAPDGGFTDADLEAFSEAFDTKIYPTVVGGFGSESDLDGNERVVILFTGTVNQLTARGAAGYVGGFFYGLDLLETAENSNKGEVFYALVPDPSGTLSDPRPTSEVLKVMPAILAHEFQHMIQFNRRILEMELPSSGALWLSEGLAQMAEELVARAYEDDGAFATAEEYRAGNLTRAKRYLDDPSSVSLVVATGQGSLEERGAGWLHVLYLVEQYGASILGRMTATDRLGAENVAHEAGTPWEDILADWWAALYLDGRGSYGAALSYGSFGLRSRLIASDGSDALEPTQLGTVDFRDDVSFWSSSARHYILRPPSGGSVVIRLGGEGGGTAPAGSELGLRIVRLF